MDVRCERCGTEYDFDDALVSERGTTVKCTNCGHQFKVFPKRASGVGPERWIVRIATGGVISFTSLRELQKGIAAGRVGPADLLSRGGQPPRPLSSIAELEPFFKTAVPHAGVGGKTLAGVAPPVRPDGSLPPQPFASATADRPSAVAPGSDRKRGVTAPRLPTFETGGASVSDPPTQRRPDVLQSLAGREQDGPAPPVTQAVPAADGRDRVAAPGRLRADTAGMLADTLPGGALRTPVGDNRSGPSLGGGTLRIESPASPGEQGADQQAPARSPEPAVQAEAPVVESRPEAEADVSPNDSKPGRASAEPAAEPSQTGAAAADLDAAPAGMGASSESSVRQVPAVEPLDPAPTDAVEAVAARTEPQIQADAEKFFTPPPRELSFSGSLSDPDLRYVPRASPQGARGRWIFGVVMLGSLALLAGTVGLSFIQRYSQPRAPESPVVDPRVGEFVANGRRLVDQGDLDGAAEELSKASVLAEREPTVLVALAELEVVRADRLWLQLRLLDREAEDRVAATRGQLGARLARAREAVAAAVAASDDDVAVVRVQVDALRLAGKLKEARRHVAPLSENASEPANAYVLAVLDLAEAQPALLSAIEHLRKAVSAEGRIGRARSALIYALALNGDVDAARSELSALAGVNEVHPLLPDLRAFVRRVGEEGDETVLDADELALVERVDATAPSAAREESTDFRARLAQANSALRNGLLDQAKRLYRGVLDEQPGNTEAMAGLAEVARQRNDPGAAEMYDKVLEKNPSYLPALMARADQKWASGDRSGAVTLYRRVLAQAGPATSYGRRAQARIAEGAGASAEPTAAPTAAPEPAPAPESTPTEPAEPVEPQPEQPPIDTTDLPGFQ